MTPKDSSFLLMTWVSWAWHEEYSDTWGPQSMGPHKGRCAQDGGQHPQLRAILSRDGGGLRVRWPFPATRGKQSASRGLVF